ncbi:MAG: glycoside hydrolase [Gemmatimonadales bacterium]|nr:MAG: glycoside hydrolase [Gemmatimonadales bacterium]
MDGNRTLLLTSDFPPLGGGIARLCAELAARRQHWIVSTPVEAGPFAGAKDRSTEVDPARVERLDIGVRAARSLPGVARWTRHVLERERRERFDLVYCANLKPAGYVARVLKSRRGTPYVVAGYGRDLLSARRQASSSLLKRRLLGWILGGASAMVVPSRWSANRARALLEDLQLCGSGPRVETIRPGVDVDRFRPGLDTGAVRLRYKIPQRGVLLTVARLERHKGIDTVLRALRELEDMDVTYVVAGEGAAAGELKQLALDLAVGARVRWLGRVPEADLAALYNSAEVYVGMSRETGLEAEGFGLSFLEAAACGLPVVAGAGGGVADAVADGETGCLLEPKAADRLAVVLRRLLSDRQLRVRLGTAGRVRAAREFSWERVCRELDRLEQVVRRAPGSGCLAASLTGS